MDNVYLISLNKVQHELRLSLFYVFFLFKTACPRRKYGTECDETCRTCYNGGLCADDSDICICPPGFMGDHCEIGKHFLKYSLIFDHL